MEAVEELVWTGSYGSTTIDQICEKAGVKKGSFYYFFDSKAELAETSIEEAWQKHRVQLDSIFSPTIPPLDRLRKYCDYSYDFQHQMKAKYGHVLAMIAKSYETKESKIALEYSREALIGGPEIFNFSSSFSSLHDALIKKDKVIIDSEIADLRKTLDEYFKDYDAETDMKIFIKCFAQICDFRIN